MKNLLILLLLLAIPFQYSWAAAARYCTHETGKVSHFGHHTHQHEAQPAKSDGDGKVAKADTDCESCHLFSHATAISTATTLAPPLAEGHIPISSKRYSSYIPDRPPPPDWPLVA